MQRKDKLHKITNNKKGNKQYNYAMYKKSCPKSVPGLTNMSKNTKMVSPQVTFMLLYGICQTLSSILSPNGA